MFLNTEAKTPGITEISPQQLIFLDLQAALQKLHCLVASNSDVACNLFIPSNTKGTDGVPSCNKYKSKRRTNQNTTTTQNIQNTM